MLNKYPPIIMPLTRRETMSGVLKLMDMVDNCVDFDALGKLDQYRDLVFANLRLNKMFGRANILNSFFTHASRRILRARMHRISK